MDAQRLCSERSRLVVQRFIVAVNYNTPDKSGNYDTPDESGNYDVPDKSGNYTTPDKSGNYNLKYVIPISLSCG